MSNLSSQSCTFNADSSRLLHPDVAGFLSRRDFLIRNGVGFGGLSLAALFGINPFDLNAAPAGPLAPKAPHFPGKAKAVIQIYAGGAPSTVDTWDYKPELQKNDGKKIPGYEGLAFGSPFQFNKCGKSGLEISEIFPEISKHADNLAVIKSLFTEIPDHEIAGRMLTTGSAQLPKPSLGSWAIYGLGSVNQNMPGFISLGGNPIHRQCAFLPGLYQGCNVNYDPNASLATVLANIRSEFSTLDRQRRQIDFAAQANREHAAALQKDAQLEARIEAFEIAFKMQTEATDAFDISKEPEAMRERYMGASMNGRPGPQSANGSKMLVARRLVERGVRFVQVASSGGWDHHQNLATAARQSATAVDGPVGALLQDLKERGMLDSTLVMWGGEFGRTPTSAATGATAGRDHNGNAMVSWMAGGGVKGGQSYGATDEFGGKAVENRMHIHDLHATILALMGLDHTKLTYKYNGRDFRLTDNFGNVAKELIA
ncbi:MAG: DUF1501 domain-containing protein [Verrucomicrobiota bacterium]